MVFAAGCSPASPTPAAPTEQITTPSKQLALHQDAVINELLNRYNTISGETLTTKDIDQDLKYETMVTVSGGTAYISDSSNRKKVDIEITVVKPDYPNFVMLASDFMKAADSEMNAEKIGSIFTEIEGNRYADKPYTIGRWEMTLSTTSLSGKEDKQYIFKSSFHNKKE